MVINVDAFLFGQFQEALQERFQRLTFARLAEQQINASTVCSIIEAPYEGRSHALPGSVSQSRPACVPLALLSEPRCCWSAQACSEDHLRTHSGTSTQRCDLVHIVPWCKTLRGGCPLAGELWPGVLEQEVYFPLRHCVRVVLVATVCSSGVVCTWPVALWWRVTCA